MNYSYMYESFEDIRDITINDNNINDVKKENIIIKFCNNFSYLYKCI